MATIELVGYTQTSFPTGPGGKTSILENTLSLLAARIVLVFELNRYYKSYSVFFVSNKFIKSFSVSCNNLFNFPPAQEGQSCPYCLCN